MMLSSVKKYLARQARMPFGLFGRIVAPMVFNRENKEMERFGLELMSPEKDDRILEIGFGNGQLIAEVMPLIEAGKVCGIDISDQMVALASIRNKEWIEKGSLELQKGSVENIPYPEEYFEKIFTANTIYFWPGPESCLHEVKRVLKTGGRFFCALRLREQMESKGSVVTGNPDVFEHLYQEDEVKKLFEGSGFRDVNLHLQAGNPENLYIISGRK